jgi:hypothetical protein
LIIALILETSWPMLRNSETGLMERESTELARAVLLVD